VIAELEPDGFVWARREVASRRKRMVPRCQALLGPRRVREARKGVFGRLRARLRPRLARTTSHRDADR